MSRLRKVEELSAGRHFDREMIILCVRWYLRYKLSLRDLVEMMAERELNLAHTTILRWVHRFAPIGTLRLKHKLCLLYGTRYSPRRRKHLKWLPPNFVAVCTKPSCERGATFKQEVRRSL